ncbi:hypothetical protein [Streptomyces sp. WAC07061]|uniref:hypothetical protein n=1 Tax=Streptomyces sp. WAC07061 TaxID=2487410 RepID=UPI0026A68622|nr:hypothetical protein [Streptomyces sp. WAC07061]
MADAVERGGAGGHAGVIGGGGRLGAVRILLWALAAVLGARQAAAVLRVPPGEWLSGLDLPGSLPGPLYGAGQFTGTPFAGLVLKPLAGLAAPSLEVAWTCVTLLLVAGVGRLGVGGGCTRAPTCCWNCC